MTRNDENNLSAEKVCQVLRDRGLLSGKQKKEILSKGEVIRRKLEKVRAMRQTSASSKGRVLNPITIVDVITSLKGRPVSEWSASKPPRGRELRATLLRDGSELEVKLRPFRRRGS